MHYLMHNILHQTFFFQHAPKDKLLVLKLGDGLKPLCEFLGKDVPDMPYPWRNKDGSDIQGIVDKHPFTKQVERETLLNLACIIAVIGLVLYYLIL